MTNVKYDFYICKKCLKDFSVVDKFSLMELYKDEDIGFTKAYEKYCKSLEDFSLKNRSIPFQKSPEKCPHCSSDSELFLKQGEDFFHLSIYRCNDCKNNFAVGIHPSYLQYYTRKGLTYDQSFDEYYKEMRGFGASISHFRRLPEFCPYCGSKDFGKEW